MAARKKTTRKKSARKKSARKKGGAKLIDTIEKELADLSKTVDKRVNTLRKEVDKAERKAGTEGARLLREAKKRLNKLEIGGHSEWRSFLRKSRRGLSDALSDLEKSVRPKKKAARKKAAKKKATRKKAARR